MTSQLRHHYVVTAPTVNFFVLLYVLSFSFIRGFDLLLLKRICLLISYHISTSYVIFRTPNSKEIMNCNYTVSTDRRARIVIA